MIFLFSYDVVTFVCCCVVFGIRRSSSNYRDTQNINADRLSAKDGFESKLHHVFGHGKCVLVLFRCVT